MKLLFLSDNFPPEVNAPANRTYEHCKEWVKQGISVTVITCVPNFPKGKVYEGYKNKLYQKEIIDGIEVIRVWTYITANEGFIKRILDYLSFAFMSFFAGLFIKADLIIATSPQFFTAVSGCFLSLFKRKKWVMEVRDIWPESIVAVGAMKRNLIIRFFEWVEKRLYKSADHIVVVTESFKKKLISRGVIPEKISVFKNGANMELFQPIEKPWHLLKKYSLEGKFVIAYIGTHGMAHGLHFILESVAEIQNSHSEIVFVFIGDGAEKKNLIQKANVKNLTNVLFIDSVPKNLVNEYLNMTDVALVNLKKSDTFQEVIPSKIFEAAATRKPILLGLEGETKEIINNYNAGITFSPEDKNSFLKSVLILYQDPESYSKFKNGCEKLATDFDRKLIAKAMIRKLNTIV